MTGYRRKHDRHEPRSWWSLFFRLGGLVALYLGGALLILTLFSAGTLYVADRLDRQGMLARAVVSAKRQETEGGAAHYYVTFTYKVKGESGRSVEAPVSAAQYYSAIIGQEWPIRYLPGDPGRIDTDIGFYREFGERLRGAGLVAGLIGLAILWMVGRRANRAVRVRRDGVRVLAQVTGIRALKKREGGAQQARLQWREPDGRTGESLEHDANWLRETYGPEDRVAVFRLGRLAYWEGDVGPARHNIAPPEEVRAGHSGKSG